MTLRTRQEAGGLPSTDTLPGAIPGAISRCADAHLAGAVQAADLLPSLLADIIATRHWGDSALTRDGFPLAFDFSSATDALTHTSAVIDAREDPAQALPRAITLIERLGAAPPPPIALALAGLQAEGTLEYGAWLRVRYDASTPSFRIQVEVPPQQYRSAQQPLLDVLGVRSLLPAAPVPGASAINYDVDDGSLEFAFRPAGIEPWQLERMAQIAGFGARFAELTEAITAVAGATLANGLPAAGFAVRLDSDNAPQRFAVTCDAAQLLGPDACIRRCVMRVAANLGWDLGAYPAVSAPLRARMREPVLHGQLRFAIGADGPVEFALQLRPPD